MLTLIANVSPEFSDTMGLLGGLGEGALDEREQDGDSKQGEPTAPDPRCDVCRCRHHHRGHAIQDFATAPRSPWQNAYVERFIGSIRRECLDHVIVLSPAGLQRMLTDYAAYYMCSRTHLGLDKNSPTPRFVIPPAAGRIVAIPEVNGPHHRYDRAAA
jgi:hypothetical protein